MATTFKFGPATSNDGFTSFSTSAFNDLPPARIVRELIQNSLDAAVEAGETTAKVRFQVDKVRSQDIPDHRGFANAFKKAVAHQSNINGGKLPDAAQEVVDRIQNGLDSLKSGEAALLSVSDNGIGLDVKRMNSLLADGSSGKSTSASGSYGVGHLAPMALSDIRYMLYGGLTAEGERIVCGKTILASHPGKKRLNDAKGYLVEGFKGQIGLDGNLYDFLDAAPRLIAKHLNALSKEHGHGCVVLIPAFNNFRSRMPLWEIVSKVVSYNFAPAIHQGKLVIAVREGSSTQELNAASIASILEQEQDRSRVARSDSFFAGLRPSGLNAYSILKALTDNESQNVSVNGDTARINLLIPPLSGRTRIDLFRNGMWITDSIPGLLPADFANLQPFHAVIMVDSEDGGELHRLIRKAEGPMHDKLSMSLLSTPGQEKLKQALKEIAAWINKQVPPVGTDEYTVDDFLVVSTGDDGSSGDESFSFWGKPTAVSRRTSAQAMPLGNDGNDDEIERDRRGNDRRRSRPKSTQQRPHRPLPFRSAVTHDGDGKLIGSVISTADFPEAWLTIRVDENTDFTCDRIWQDEDVSIRSFQITPIESGNPPPNAEIVHNGRFVKIQDITADTNYEVKVEYDAPPELSDIVERPVLRLEMHRPPPQANPNADDEEKSQDANHGN